ncbi:MAG: hypothetical protein ACE5PT_03670 [Gemmatimonadales bacterium]
MKASTRSRALLSAALLAVAPWVVQAQVNDDGTRLERALSGLEWREIGPAVMGGRIADLAVVESNPAIFYVGTATGGVWKTANHGTTWEPLFDDQPTSSIGDVTLAPSNPNIVWVGTGEPQNRQSSPWGNGVYRSMDGGRTWTHMGLAETRHVGRLAIHPTNPDIVYVAAVGHLWGPNEERGVFKTTDGGRTWSKVLYVDENTGAIDIVMDPGDPQTLFAAMYQRRRTAWGFNGGGPGSGLYRTLDGGQSWERLSAGLPQVEMGRIGLDIYRRDGNIVYAVIEADPGGAGGFGGFGGGEQQQQPQRNGGIFRSTDRGETWEHLSDWNPRPMYFSLIRIDPNDPERIYLGGVQLSASDDGGKTWNRNAAASVHSDHHALWIDPNNSNHLIMGSDGGVSVSFDRSTTWRMYDNLPIGQFYEVGVDMRDPYNVCGGLQDNGSWCGPSRTHTTNGIRNSDWYNINGGDGFYVRIDPNDPTIVFTESQNGNVAMLATDRWERRWIRPEPPEPPEREEAREERPSPFATGYRWNWNAPIVLSAHDPSTIYVGGNHLLKSTDRGVTWQEVSPDLTKQLDRSELEIMGVKVTARTLSRNDGVSSYGNITTVSESPLNASVLYVGTDDGNVQGTRDGGATWTDLTPRVEDLPERTYVSRVVASAHEEGTVYATFDGHYNDDYRPYVYVSRDYGENWRRITDGLPDWSVNVIAEHPRNPNLLFLGNEIGVYVSVDMGASWTRLKNNLPTVPVDDIAIHPRDNDLILGTHGRSVWILDDITPLEELSADVLAAPAHLFGGRAATVANVFSPQGWLPGAFEARNPPSGVRIRYYLRDPVQAPAVAGDDDNRDGAGKVKLTILDEAGEVVRELEGPGVASGSEVVWDLRLAPPYEPEEEQLTGFARFFGRPRGPRVLPGTYTVRLDAAGQTASKELEVRLDPRVEVSQADLELRQAALMTLYRLAKPVYEAGRRVQRLQQQVREARRLLREIEAAPDELNEEARSLSSALREVSGGLGGARRANRLFFRLEGWTGRPTPTQERQIDEAWSDAVAAIEQLNEIITERMPAFNQMLNEHGIRPAPGEPIAVPVRPGG